MVLEKKSNLGIHFAKKRMYDFSFLNELLDKGKPLERVGRKATGLSSDFSE